MAFWLALRCWIPYVTRCRPPDNRISVFSEITPDPTIHSGSGRAQMQALQPQVVIGFGGSSAMDAAKSGVWFSQQSGDQHRNLRGDPDHQRHQFGSGSACVISDPDKGQYPLFNNAAVSGYGDPRPRAGGRRTAANYRQHRHGRADPRHRKRGFHRTPATLPTLAERPPNWCSSICPTAVKKAA